jgi:hypothetical protein
MLAKAASNTGENMSRLIEMFFSTVVGDVSGCGNVGKSAAGGVGRVVVRVTSIVIGWPSTQHACKAATHPDSVYVSRASVVTACPGRGA